MSEHQIADLFEFDENPPESTVLPSGGGGGLLGFVLGPGIFGDLDFGTGAEGGIVGFAEDFGSGILGLPQGFTSKFIGAKLIDALDLGDLNDTITGGGNVPDGVRERTPGSDSPTPRILSTGFGVFDKVLSGARAQFNQATAELAGILPAIAGQVGARFSKGFSATPLQAGLDPGTRDLIKKIAIGAAVLGGIALVVFMITKLSK